MNLFQAMQMVQQFSNNPMSLLQRYNIPKECNTPDSVAKYLIDNGRVTQDQVNQVRQFFNR